MEILPKSSESVTTAAESAAATEALLTALAERYPTFAKVQPLAIGVHAEILADWPEIDPQTLKAALKRYARSFQYRKALERKGSHRFHLDGSDAGEVSAEHRQPRFKPKKLKPPAPDPTPPAVEAPPPAATDTRGRPILKLKSKAGPVTTATTARKEAK